MRTFQFSDAKSHKFWNIDVQGSAFTVTFGKIGTAGQTQTKTFKDDATAQAEADKLVKEKTKKGYVETTPKAAGSEEEAFVSALQKNPHDFAGWCAYADFLAEKGDPRGEFMQTQIALEDEKRPKAERDALKKKEAALLKEHEKEWVGDWADDPNAKASTDEWSPPDEEWVPYRFTRGVLSAIEIGELTVGLARKIVKAPQLQFVRDLTVHGVAYEEEGEEDEDGEYTPGPDTANVEHGDPAQYVLVRWPQLRYIRTFNFGGCEPHDYDTDWNPFRSHMPGELTADFAKQMPDIEELRIMAHFREESNRLVALPMPSLRVLLLYHGWNYPLDKLAKNASLTNLRELYCHPHALEGGDEPYIQLQQLRAVCRSKVLTSLTHLQLRLANFGDEGIAEIINSGMLKRLKLLDLRHGLVTDDGAKALAACPDLKNLDKLDLSWNRLTNAGVDALKKTGVNAVLNRQQAGNTDEWETFGQGDIE
jgi:uncharacterized protein (TIGR02996 family)